MIQKRIKLTALFVCGIALALNAFTACSDLVAPSGGTIHLNSVGYVDFHTDLQLAYLDDAPDAMSTSIDGKNENSKPKATTLTWTAEGVQGPFNVYLSERSDLEKAVTFTTQTSSVDIINLKIATTYYWKVENANGNTVSEVGRFETIDQGPRNLDIDGVTNVRDVGGWLTSFNDTRIVQGLLYRGARLNNSYPEGFKKGGDDTGYEYQAEITEKGKKTFREELGIKTEIDFRTRDRNGYPGTTDQNETLFASVEGTEYISIPMSGSASILDSKQELQRLFAILANKNSYPVYYHCNIGTDRTGMVSYLLGALCGVSQGDLYYDYMFSNFGTIALPNAYSSNPKAKVLTDLTTGNGAASVVASFKGETLVKKAEACLKECGISESTYNAVRDILLGKTAV